MTEVLHDKYRPRTFDEVIGHTTIIKSLKAIILRGGAQTFLFCGPSGCGKTTLARISARTAGCLDANITEIDAASRTGVDDMRSIQEMLRYKPFGQGTKRAVILDECFVKGTLVNTPNGDVPIEQLLSGDKVLGAHGEQTVASVSKRLVPLSHIVRLRLESGHHIISSQEHPFLTFGGWINARDLHAKRLPTNASNIPQHLSSMWDPVYEQKKWINILSRVLEEKMRNLWRILSSAANIPCNYVFTKMRSQTWWFETSWTISLPAKKKQSTCGSASKQTQKTRDVGWHCQTMQYSNASQQPNAQSSDSRKDATRERYQWHASHMDRRTRWEWQGTNSGTNVTTLLSWWAVGTCCYVWAWSKAKGMAILLQNRHRFSEAAIGYRGGWWNTQLSTTTPNRQAQGRATTVIGVDHPSLQELTNIGQFPCGSLDGEALFEFYDLEIKEHPSFSVANVIVHNCHSLSKNAWQSLLKITEKPPEHAFWFFCTTEPSKVPDTIKTRAASYTLRDVPNTDLGKLYDKVAEAEDLELPGDVGDTIIKEARGSPRQLLVNLELCRNARSRKEASELLHTASQSDAMIELCRFLVKGGSWMKAMGLLEQLDGENPESIRIVVANYMASVAKGAKTDRAACHALGILDAFSQPFNQSDKLAPLITAIGRVLFTEG